MSIQSKPRVAFFDFACCEGCQLSVLELERTLLDLLEHVEIVEWREAISEQSDEYDIAFCEGSITRDQDIDRIEKIRERADILVTLGTCASLSCHNALKNRWPMQELLELVYGEQGQGFDTISARPISDVVEADYETYGCPLSLPEFVSVFKHILTGQEYDPPNQPVCVECKLADNLCVLEKGIVCLGPLTRCGCEAICTRYGDACYGCRGLMKAANVRAALKALVGDDHHSIMQAAIDRNDLTQQEIRDRLAVYNARAMSEREGSGANER